MLLGILTAVVFLFECTLPFIKKHCKHPHPFLARLHCIVGFSVLVLAILHFSAALKLWRQRPLLMSLSGCLMLFLLLVMCLLSLRKKHAKKLHRILAITAAILLGVHIFSGITSFFAYQNAISGIEIEELTISSIPDGIYEGECDAGYIYARVSVEITDGKINHIELLEHRNERGAAAEAITDQIILQQKIKVDAISSATNSSKVIQKAVCNALAHANK